jgi:hypothetical protein
MWFMCARICSAFLLWTVSATANPTFANAVTNGIVDIAGLSEASGVVASRNNPGVLWTHNDSGHPAQIYAIDTQGRLLGTYDVPGNTDNEDIAIGPGPVANVQYLYIGDIGDNASARANIQVYQFPEPEVYARQYTNPPSGVAMKGARTLTITYPDGAHNAEAMFVDPITGDLFIATKQTPSRLYTATKAQTDTSTNFVLTFLGTFDFDVPSAADISPYGHEIIVRQENYAYLYVRTNGQSISDALGGTPTSIPVTGVADGEPNGEAIGFDAIGSGYFTLSDSATVQPLRYFARTSDDAPAVAPLNLISLGSNWKYLDNGSNQSTSWRNPSFDDSGWSNGLAQLGYGDGDEQTVVGYGGDANSKYITTYFRTKFLVSNAGDLTNLLIKLVVDDGAAIFLNGVPVCYYHVATNAIWGAAAVPEQPTELEDTWFTFPVDPALLFNGTNMLAAEVHQRAGNSSDISFDLQLVGSGRGAAYESFNYPLGTSLVLITNSVGQWWSAAGSGTSNVTVINDNLTVAGLSSSMGSAMQFGAQDGPSGRFNLIAKVTTGTLYYSLALKVTNLGMLSYTGGPIAAFNNSRGTQGNTPSVLGTRILTRAIGSDSFNVGVAKNSTSTTDWVWATNIFNLGETIFLAGSYTFNSSSSSDDVSFLWINPSPTDFGSNPAPAPTLSATTGPDINANQIFSFVFLQSGQNNTNEPAAMIADELRIGTTWASVTPRGTMPPRLNIARIGGKTVLSWSLTAPEYSLETAVSLAITSTWTAVSSPVSILGDQFLATNAISPNAFFRLRK